MEANLFRYLVSELSLFLQGQRIDKVYQPAVDVWTIKFSSKSHLIGAVGKKENALFWDPSRPSNPVKPSGQAQWLRKRLRGRRIAQFKSAWSQRRLAWELIPDGYWLVWDVCTGPSIMHSLPDGFDAQPKWPTSLEQAMQPQSWRSFPQLTPPLRSSLKEMDSTSAWGLLQRLAAFSPTSFYCYGLKDGLIQALPWRLPEKLRQDKRESRAEGVLDAARKEGQGLIQSRLNRAPERQKVWSRAWKRLKRQEQRLKEDEQRLRSMLALKDEATLLQANLYQTDKRAKLDRLDLLDASGRRHRVALDPVLSVQGNMERYFAKARKGRRGLVHVQRRREELAQRRQALERSEPGETPLEDQGPGLDKTLDQVHESGLRPPKRFQGLALHVYRTHNGLLILRGKNNKANHGLLTKAARPFDLWFHAQDCPGAHVLLVRDHEGQEVPEAALEDAANIAGLASKKKEEDRVQVMCALVRHVHAIKGAALGQVRVDKFWKGIYVGLNRQRELELRIETAEG